MSQNQKGENKMVSDLFKPALSIEAMIIFRLKRELEEFKYSLENMIFYSEYGIEERTKEEQVTIPEDLFQCVKDTLYDIEWKHEQVERLKIKLEKYNVRIY